MKIRPTHKTGGVVVEFGEKETDFSPLCLHQSTPSRSEFRLKKILVPVDFSKDSRKSVQYACAFAKQFDAGITLLHVLQPYPAVPQMDPLDVDQIDDVRGQLEAMRATIPESIPVQTVMRTGDPHAQIISTAKELQSDVVIISSHSYASLTHWFLGGTVERVARNASCPILIVREHEHDFILDTDDSDTPGQSRLDL